MFRTYWNHLLQQIDFVPFYWLMEAISFLGTAMILTLMVYVLITGIDFRKGFGVANIFLYVLLTTFMLKNQVDYPRPLAVDPTLKSFGADAGQDLLDLQPSGFFSRFSDELLVAVRQNEVARHGWPSGHTSLITALFFGSALMFRKRKLWYLTGIMIFLIMISRVYLARHYLGDVLGGLLVGWVVSYCIYHIWQRTYHETIHLSTSVWIFYLAPVVFLPFYGYFPPFQLSGLIGFNISYLVILSNWGTPKYSEYLIYRIWSVLVFFLTGYLVVYIAQQVTITSPLLALTIFTTLSFGAFMLAAWICRKAEWWRFQTES